MLKGTGEGRGKCLTRSNVKNIGHRQSTGAKPATKTAARLAAKATAVVDNFFATNGHPVGRNGIATAHIERCIPATSKQLQSKKVEGRRCRVVVKTGESQRIVALAPCTRQAIAVKTSIVNHEGGSEIDVTCAYCPLETGLRTSQRRRAQRQQQETHSGKHGNGP